MEIAPISTQSIQYSQHVEGPRTVITRREYQDIGGKITVTDINYYVYNQQGQVEESRKPQVDLRV